MNGTTKTILIVAGTAIGVFVLIKFLSPPPTTIAGAKPNKQATDVLNLNSLIGLGTAIAGAFGSSSSSPNDGTYHADTSGFSISGNTLVDSSGNAQTYGAGY